MDEIDDAAAAELLRRIDQGDEKAFNDLFHLINRRVYLFAVRRLGNPQDAEEVSIGTAMELWRQPGRYRGDSRFITYVLGIANNKALGILRSRARRAEDPEDDVEQVPDDDPTPFEALRRKEMRAAIARCMEQLSERQQSILHLVYFEDLSREETGRIIDCEANLVRQHLFQALRKMKPCLAGWGLQ